MIAAPVLILLAEATTACAPSGAYRLGGGATMIRPIGTFEPLPFEQLGPAPSVVTRPTEIQQTGAASPEPDADEPEAEQPAQQCEIISHA